MNVYLFDTSGVLNGPVQLPVVPGIGIQVPGNGVELAEILALPAEGYVWILVDGKPGQLADRRGQVFDTGTGKPQEWTELGELPETLTAIPWPGTHYVWIEDNWQLDTDAQFEALLTRALDDRDGRLQQAAIRIAPLQDAVELGEATKEEETALIEWKRYRVALNRIEQREDFPLNIEWPTPPESIKYK